MKKIVVLASGSGTNAENIISFFNKTDVARVTCLLSNKKDAYALKRAENLNVSTLVFDREAFYETDEVLHFIQKESPDLVVLAGFLLLVPSKIVKAFSGKIVNIHPALLPKYGGKGMYGDKVHESVVNNKELETGITIHYVNENYDEGDIIFQATCSVSPTDDAATVAKKVHELEYEHFPKVLLSLLAR